MNKPINIKDLRSIKITPSSERVMGSSQEKDWVYRDEMGQRISDGDSVIKELLWWKKYFENVGNVSPKGFFCDISKAGLDKWEQEADERVMKAVDNLILYSDMFSGCSWYSKQDCEALFKNTEQAVVEYVFPKRPSYEEEVKKLYSLYQSRSVKYYAEYDPYKSDNL